MEADLTCCGCMLATVPYVVWLGVRERRERREEERKRVEEERERMEGGEGYDGGEGGAIAQTDNNIK